MEFVIVNGQIIKKEEFIPFDCDGTPVLVQKIWFGHGGIPLLHENLAILRQEVEVSGVVFPDWLEDKTEVFRVIKRMLNKNMYYRSGIISIVIHNSKNKTNFHIESLPSGEFPFPVSKQGIILGFSALPVFSGQPLNKFAFYHIPLWKVAHAAIGKSLLSNVVFLNEKGFVTHCISANIFAIKNKVLHTPSTETGRWTGSLLPTVLEVSSGLNLKIIETGQLSKTELLQMDEIFIASEVKGIEWVMGIENKRFVNLYSGRIQEKINEFLKSKAS